MSRVLVVDDDRACVDGLRRLLSLDGYDVVGVRSSVAARDLLHRERFDAVITDLEMPVVHGIEIVGEARATDPATPVVVISAYCESPVGALALKRGAFRLISKPVDYDLLADALARALRGGGS